MRGKGIGVVMIIFANINPGYQFRTKDIVGQHERSQSDNPKENKFSSVLLRYEVLNMSRKMTTF